MEKMNVFRKLQECRCELQKQNLKKSGENKFAGFSYYELGDFIPAINQLFLEKNLTSNFSIDPTSQEAKLTIVNIENSLEKIEFTSPVADANIKGCTPIQSLGGVHTYLKRYLYMNALEIVESDLFEGKDGTIEPEEPQKTETYTKASEKQIALLLQAYRADNLTKLLEANNIEKIEDISMKKASELISQLMKKGDK